MEDPSSPAPDQPSFLHNTLNIIYWESIRLTGGENLCSQMISNLSSMMRYSLSDAQEDVLVEDEISYLEKYVSIMKLRYPGLFETIFFISPECADASVKENAPAASGRKFYLPWFPRKGWLRPDPDYCPHKKGPDVF